MRREREFEVFSLSFLDCICCGFGAIILLIVVSDFKQPATLEASRRDLRAQVQLLTQQLQQIRGESDTLHRELAGRVEELQKERMHVGRLAGDLTHIKGQFAASREEASAVNRLTEELVASRRTLTSDTEKLLAERRSHPRMSAVGGIPVDSEYVIFLIDTSSSMTDNHWDVATRVLQEILDIYPHLAGIQILSDKAKPMFSGTQGTWLDDTPARRKEMVTRMKNWRVYSESNPVDGIRDTIRTYWSPGRRISLYVLGDEFTGESMQQALDAVAAANKPDASGQRPVRIHAVGFPEAPGFPPFTSIRFSALMRLMCEQNGGTFVGLLQ
ncbi:MAG TPA: hypothetical protein VLW26_01265 [Steroidobacteraceae bacterium]|nr:hypothetical protein [Steroidobacteraceae bacterium]